MVTCNRRFFIVQISRRMYLSNAFWNVFGFHSFNVFFWYLRQKSSIAVNLDIGPQRFVSPFSPCVTEHPYRHTPATAAANKRRPRRPWKAHRCKITGINHSRKFQLFINTTICSILSKNIKEITLVANGSYGYDIDDFKMVPVVA